MMKRFMMVMAPVIGVATANFEAGVFVYWSAANSLTLLQSAVLRVPAARAAVGPCEACRDFSCTRRFNGSARVCQTKDIATTTYTAVR